MNAPDFTNALPEEFFRTMVNNTGNVAWVVSRNQEKVIFINRDFSGVKKEVILEKGFTSVWPVMDIESLQRLLRAFDVAVMEGKRTENVRTSHRNTVTGEKEFYLNSVFPMYGADGRVSHIQVSSRDVTQIVRASRIIEVLNSISTVMQNNIFSRNLFKVVGDRLKKQQIHVIIVIKTGENMAKIAHHNFPARKMKAALAHLNADWAVSDFPLSSWPAMVRILKRGKGEFFDDPYEYLKSRAMNPQYRENMGRALEILNLKKIIVAPMIVNRESLGSFMMTSELFSPTDLAAVKAFAVQFSHALMFSQFQSQGSRLRSLLANFLQNTAEAVFAVNSDGSVVLWNRKAAELFAYRKEEILGQKIERLGIGSTLWNELRGEVKQKQRVKRNKVRLVASDGTAKAVHLTATAVDAGKGKGYGMLFLVRP